jgi:hypothetical protein
VRDTAGGPDEVRNALFVRLGIAFISAINYN